MTRRECGRFRCTAGATIGKLALMMLVILTVASSVPVAAKDKGSTQVYQHTYDEVFQASQEAIERMGMYVSAKDKDKGTISGNGIFNVTGSMGPVGKKCTLNIHIETLNTKPETQVTVSANVKGVWGGWANTDLERKLSMQIQQVLSTYH